MPASRSKGRATGGASRRPRRNRPGRASDRRRPVQNSAVSYVRQHTGRISALIASIGDRAVELPSFQRVAVGLERKRERLERELVSARARAHMTPGGVDAVVDELLDALDRLPEVLAQESRTRGGPS
jgi:hypothetical protein